MFFFVKFLFKFLEITQSFQTLFRHKNKPKRFFPVEGTWTETVPFIHNTKEAVMGPFQSFLRSINNQEQDLLRKRERRSKFSFPAAPISQMADVNEIQKQTANSSL